MTTQRKRIINADDLPVYLMPLYKKESKIANQIERSWRKAGFDDVSTVMYLVSKRPAFGLKYHYHFEIESNLVNGLPPSANERNTKLWMGLCD